MIDFITVVSCNAYTHIDSIILNVSHTLFEAVPFPFLIVLLYNYLVKNIHVVFSLYTERRNVWILNICIIILGFSLCLLWVKLGDDGCFLLISTNFMLYLEILGTFCVSANLLFYV